MTFFEFSIGDDDIDRRLDRVIRKFLKLTPLSLVYKNIRSGFIRINKAKVKNEYRLKKGDILYVEKNFYLKNEQTENEKILLATSSSTIHFDTIFENEHLKVINKPYGVGVQAATKNETSLDSIIKDMYAQDLSKGLQKASLSFLPGPLHRLDKNTTGVLAFSQSLKGARYFSEAMVAHTIKKEYICILTGILEHNCTWKHAIEKDSVQVGGEFVTVSVSEISQCSDTTKHAITHVYPLGSGFYFDEPITLAKVYIETGKTHQIRSQSAFCNYPLLGDTAYGYRGKAKQFFLHAWSLELPKDNTIGVKSKLIAQMPISFKDFVKSHLPNIAIPSYNDSDETCK